MTLHNPDLDHDDYEVEPVPGLPERLPEGEHIVWQGQPNWWRLAVSAFHIRKVGWYFLALGVWELLTGIDDGTGAMTILIALGKLSLVAAIAMGMLALLAWGSAREAVYTLTNKRIVMRFGIALRLALNLPFDRLESASMKPMAEGCGDIALLLNDEDRISYVILWPHARRWRMRRPEPTLRCIDNVTEVARLLAAQLPAITETTKQHQTELQTVKGSKLGKGAAVLANA